MAKGLSYRFFGTVLTGTFTFIVTGNVRAALLIGSTEVTAKLILFWGHERLWNMIAWGRRRAPAASVASVASVAPVAPVAIVTELQVPTSSNGHGPVPSAFVAQRR